MLTKFITYSDMPANRVPEKRISTLFGRKNAEMLS